MSNVIGLPVRIDSGEQRTVYVNPAEVRILFDSALIEERIEEDSGNLVKVREPLTILYVNQQQLTVPASTEEVLRALKITPTVPELALAEATSEVLKTGDEIAAEEAAARDEAIENLHEQIETQRTFIQDRDAKIAELESELAAAGDALADMGAE